MWLDKNTVNFNLHFCSKRKLSTEIELLFILHYFIYRGLDQISTASYVVYILILKHTPAVFAYVPSTMHACKSLENSTQSLAHLWLIKPKHWKDGAVLTV